MALTKTARTLVSSTSRAAGAAATRSTPLDLQSTYGGLVTMKITNTATGPTAPCEGRVLVAHNATTPGAGSAGSDWKTLDKFNGGSLANGITERSFVIDPSVMQLEVEFEGNTAQSVTVEALFSELTSL